MASSSLPLPQNTRKFTFRHLWDSLTKPHPSFQNADERRRARSASGLLLIISVLLAAEIVIPDHINIPSLASVLLLFAFYLVSRTRHWMWAVAGAMLVVSLSIFWRMALVTDWASTNVLGYMVWLQLPVLLGGLLLRPKFTLVLAVLINISVLGLPALVPSLPLRHLGVSSGFLITVSALIVVAAYLQEYYFVRPQLAELRQTQIALEIQNRSLEKANQDIKDFAYIVAHDLRAPTVNVVEYTKELKLALDMLRPAVEVGIRALPVESRKSVQEARDIDLPEALGYLDSSAQRMEKLIGEVLKLARVGQYELQWQPILLRALVNTILTYYSHHIHGANVNVVVQALPDKIMADHFVLEQILSNLIDNALKYLSPNRPGQLIISAEESPQETVISVRDNGRGIASEDREKVLQPFRRAANAENVEGVGVGLYYVQSLIQRHGGRIWFTSELNEGTVFSFSIPKVSVSEG